MLQFLTHRTDKYSIAEEAQMAIEGGCRWIQVTDSLDEGVSLKETVESLRQLCEENEAFLVVDHDVELTNEMKVHGVHLSKNDMSPRDAREVLGPHAVIGVDVANADDILALKGIDVDYCVLRPFGTLQPEDYRNIINAVRAAGCELPVVAAGDISIDDITSLRDAGVSGVAISHAITDAADPSAATAEILSMLVNG